MNQYRCKIIKRCFDCSCCKENLLPPKPFQIWMCCQGSNQPCRPLEAPGCEGGIPDWCPLPYQSERDNQQDTTYELCNFWKLHACKSMTTNNCWNKSCPDHDEYGSPCSFQSERDKVLDDIETVIDKTTSYVSRYELERKIAELRKAGE